MKICTAPPFVFCPSPSSSRMEVSIVMRPKSVSMRNMRGGVWNIYIPLRSGFIIINKHFKTKHLHFHKFTQVCMSFRTSFWIITIWKHHQIFPCTNTLEPIFCTIIPSVDLVYKWIIVKGWNISGVQSIQSVSWCLWRRALVVNIINQVHDFPDLSSSIFQIALLISFHFNVFELLMPQNLWQR